MHAIRLHAFGPAENLRYEEVDDPKPEPDQVRIVVAASGGPRGRHQHPAGREGPFPTPDLPMTPGREAAGTVDAVGSGVDDAWRGSGWSPRTCWAPAVTSCCTAGRRASRP